MGGYIEVSTEPLSADKGNIAAELNAVRTELQQLFQEMQELDSMWDGPASQAFAVQFQTDYEIMQEIVENLEGFIQCMQYAADEYNKCENTIAELISAIRI
ncbi:hypothetical protein PMF13cell1_01252 [Blautia producta]|uniref:ESAT-6-like protein n=1 Tax=Blautia producta TaxID=33035 RepID=A0A4V0Z766_9FIRM|nr:WXG100 family type VII secretion target [Blautia producta]QBE95728.1 hypothetical protein PMF13cell1_01252 [Blautia producta]